MHDTDAEYGRIDPEHYEPSPSTGWRETAAIMGAPDAHAVEESPEDETPNYEIMLRDTSPTLEVAT